MAETKTSVGYLPGTDPAAVQANLAYQQAQQRMQQALEARQGRMFDPEMLALAQGFLSPTKTGGFGESLGYAAKGLGEAQAQQEKEERDIAQAQLAMAGQGLELERQKARERMSKEIFGPQTTLGVANAPSGALPTSGPRGALSEQLAAPEAPAGFEVGQGVRTMPRNPDFANRRNQFIQASIAKGTDPAEILKDLAKFDENRFLKTESGIQDLAEGLFYSTAVGKQEPKQVTLRTGETVTMNVTADEAGQLDRLRRSRDPRYYDFVDSLRNAPPLTKAGKPGEAKEGEGAGEPGTVRSVEEQEAHRAKMVEAGKASAQDQAKEAQKLLARGDDASSLANDIRVINAIFSPSNKYSTVISGVFEKGDLKSQIGTLLESGLAGDAFKEAARKIATTAGLPEMAIVQFQNAISRMADLKLKASRIMEGQGTVTEAERRLIAESVINITDTPKTIIAKAEYLAARAKFEQDRANALREFRDPEKPGKDTSDFLKSKEYKRMKKDYEDELDRIVERRLGVKLPPRAGSAQPSSGRDNAMAEKKLGG